MKSAIRYAIENRAVSYFIIFILFFGGIAGFFSLGQLEYMFLASKPQRLQPNIPEQVLKR